MNGVSFTVSPREILGIAGPSGSGKSLTALSVLGLLPPSLSVMGGRIEWKGESLLTATAERLRQVRQSEIGIVFQEAQSALHPCYRVRDQISEALRARGTERRTAEEQSLELLASVGVPDPAAWGDRYPHQWSGGMRQRGLIAMALTNDPALIIADEPTSSLDVTVQAQIMELLVSLKATRDLAMVLISHDLAMLSRYADRIAVMAEGRVVQTGAAHELFANPRHEVTRKLVRHWTHNGGAVRSGTGPGRDVETGALLEVYDLAVHPGGVHAVRDINLRVGVGECVAVIGESGCGKSTLARTIMGLDRPTHGGVKHRGVDVFPDSAVELSRLRREAQMVFQDPSSALNPRRTVGWSVARPLQLQGTVSREERERRVAFLLTRVGLPLRYASYRPHQLSGGERQRVAIARALSVNPRLLILDEPFSALDAHLRGSLMELLDELRAELGLSYLLITHDLRSVRVLADRVYVVYLGRVVEHGPVADVLSRSAHPYTHALVSAEPGELSAPPVVIERVLLAGEVPDPLSAPSGCAFRSRCWRTTDLCRLQVPELVAVEDDRPEKSVLQSVACFNPCPGPR